VGIHLLVEDTEGNLICAMIYNLLVDPVTSFPPNTIFAVKEPCVSNIDDEPPWLVVDSPSDVVFLNCWDALLENTPWYSVSLLTSKQLKARGNDCFGRSQYALALKWYDMAIRNSSSDCSVIHLNRSAVFLKLNQFEDALEAAKAAIVNGNSEVNRKEQLKLKALCRLGQASYSLGNWTTALRIFVDMGANAPEDYLKKAKCRVRECERGEYDMLELAGTSGQLVEHDVADYTAPVALVDFPGKGQVVMTKYVVKRGTLLMACKAFAMVGEDRSNGLLRHERRFPLLCAILKKFRDHPYRSSELYRLGTTSASIELRDGIVDVSTLQEICEISSSPWANSFVDFECVTPRTQRVSRGIWILPSFLHHSCMPNAIGVCYGDIVMVRALKRIEPGEPISLDYFVQYCNPELRMQTLSELGWRCRCPLCVQNAATPEQVMQQRINIARAIDEAAQTTPSEQFERLVRMLEGTYKPGDRYRDFLIRPLSKLTSALYREGKWMEAIAANKRSQEIEPRPSLVMQLFPLFFQAQILFLHGSRPEAERVIKELVRFGRETAGLGWDELKIATADGLLKEFWDENFIDAVDRLAENG
jgi:tetratricopeptide (TPR) repeat protein